MKPLAGDSGLFHDPDREQPANGGDQETCGTDEALTPCGRLVGRCPGEMSGEECARLFFRVLGRRLVVFEPVEEITDARG
jgi:hypothetical protein